MDKKRWSALQTFLNEDDKISSLFANRIWFVRIPKNMIIKGDAYLIFNEMASSRDDYSNEGFEKGIDMFDIIFDIVVPYEKIGEGRQIRWYIRSLLWKFSGTLTSERSGEIIFKEYMEISHDESTDNIVLGSLYLFKEHYDYTDTGSTE